MKLSLFLLVFFGCRFAYADETASFRKFDTFFSVGWTIAPKHNTRGNINGVALPSSRGSDKSGVAAGVDNIFRFSENFGVSATVDYANSPNDSGPSDDLFFIGVGPRVAIPIGDFEIWASPMIGLGIDFLGTTSVNSGGYLITARDSSPMALEFSPRVGVDYSLNRVKLRAQISYSMATFSNSFDVRTSPALTYVGSGNLQSELTWLTATVGVAWEF